MRIFAAVYIVIMIFLAAGCSSIVKSDKEKGLEYYEQGDFAEAREYLEKAVKTDSKDPDLIVKLANCIVEVDDIPKAAIDLLGDAALQHADYAPIFFELGQIAYKYGPPNDGKNLIQALEFTHKAYAIDPLNFDVVSNLARFHLLAESPDSALVYFHEARAIDSENAELNYPTERVETLLSKESAYDSLSLRSLK